MRCNATQPSGPLKQRATLASARRRLSLNVAYCSWILWPASLRNGSLPASVAMLCACALGGLCVVGTGVCIWLFQMLPCRFHRHRGICRARQMAMERVAFTVVDATLVRRPATGSRGYSGGCRRIHTEVYMWLGRAHDPGATRGSIAKRGQHQKTPHTRLHICCRRYECSQRPVFVTCLCLL